MKKYLLAITTFLLLSHGVYSQTERKLKRNTDLLVKSDEEQITEIDSLRQNIFSHLDSYNRTKKKEDSTCYTTIYTDGKELKRMGFYCEEKKSDRKTELFFHRGKLIFIEKSAFIRPDDYTDSIPYF